MKTTHSIFKTSKLAFLVAVLGGGLTACESSTSTAQSEDYRTDNEEVAFERQPEQQRDDADKIYNDPDGDELTENDTDSTNYNYDRNYNDQDYQAETVSYDEPPQSTTVNFAFDSADLSSEARSELRELNETLTEEEYQNLRIVISGYTDAIGDRSYNQDLSERRAASVREFLRYENVEVAEVEVNGYGESNPVRDNDTAYGREQNRRVEISFEAEDPSEAYSMQ